MESTHEAAFRLQRKCSVQGRQWSIIRFWTNPWLDQPVILKFPELHSFAINPKQSATSLMNSDDMETHFQTPIYVQAYEQFTNLRDIMQQIFRRQHQDRWICKETNLVTHL